MKTLIELENFLNFEDELILNYYNIILLRKKLIKIKFQNFLKH